MRIEQQQPEKNGNNYLADNDDNKQLWKKRNLMLGTGEINSVSTWILLAGLNFFSDHSVFTQK